MAPRMPSDMHETAGGNDLANIDLLVCIEKKQTKTKERRTMKQVILDFYNQGHGDA